MLLRLFNMRRVSVCRSIFGTTCHDHANASESFTGHCASFGIGLDLMVSTASSSTAYLSRFTLDILWLPFMIRGKKMLVMMRMKMTPEKVTRESSQFLVKATIMAAMMRAVNSTNTPSFSEIPIWSTLLVEVMVETA